jgi:AcrR family transcriptional regulator
MSPRQSDSRQRLVEAAASMLAQHGFNATSIRELAKYAQAPLGSTYHHFPEGKRQVVAEALLFAGKKVKEDLERHLHAGPVQGVQAFLAMWRVILVRSHFRAGCPVLAVAIEEPMDGDKPDAIEIANEIFVEWEATLSAAFVVHGISQPKSNELAALIVASVEGGIAMCRARRDIAPFDQVGSQLEALVCAALPIDRNCA